MPNPWVIIKVMYLIQQVSVSCERVTNSFKRVAVSSKRVVKSFERLGVSSERVTKLFEQVGVSNERVTKLLEQVGVSIEQVTRSFERMQIFPNGLQTVVNRILLKNGKSLEYVFPCMVTHVSTSFTIRTIYYLSLSTNLNLMCTKQQKIFSKGKWTAEHSACTFTLRRVGKGFPMTRE